jgi:hypothetical protein
VKRILTLSQKNKNNLKKKKDGQKAMILAVPLFALMFLGLLIAILVILYQLSDRQQKSNTIFNTLSDELLGSKIWATINLASVTNKLTKDDSDVGTGSQDDTVEGTSSQDESVDDGTVTQDDTVDEVEGSALN